MPPNSSWPVLRLSKSVRRASGIQVRWRRSRGNWTSFSWTKESPACATWWARYDFPEMKQIIATEQAPKAIGPYSQAVKWNGTVFLSGQIPLDPATGQLIEGDIAAQTERVLENIHSVLEAAGSSFDRVLKTTVFLKNMGDFPKMNEVYGRYF